MPSSFIQQVESVYASKGERHILPFVGSAFDRGGGSLRVVLVGINTYISPRDWDPPEQRRQAEWFRK
jgi:hypothetical protein